MKTYKSLPNSKVWVLDHSGGYPLPETASGYGFDWGQGAEEEKTYHLAMALLIDHTNAPKLAADFIEPFSDQVLSKLDKNWTLSSDQIQQWLETVPEERAAA